MADYSTLGGRLRHAVERRGITTRRFQAEMENRLKGGKSGAAYNTILAYLNNQSEPSLEFLRQASSVLGVRFAWLVAGEGPAAEMEERAGEAEDYLVKLLRERVPQLLGEEHVTAVAKNTFLYVHAAQRHLARLKGEEEPNPEAAADWIVGYLEAPLKEFRIRWVHPEDRRIWTVGTLNTLQLVLPGKADRRVLTEFE